MINKWMRVVLPACMAAVLLLSACVAPLPTARPNTKPALPEQAPPLQPAQPDGAAASNPLSPEQAQLLAGLKSQGLAPELHNDTWINTEPLRLADLRGKVVIIEFWTYG